MSSIKLELNDFSNHVVVPIPEVGARVIGIGLDGNLKKKDSNGVVTDIGNGAQGPAGADGANGLDGVDGGNTIRWTFGAGSVAGQYGYSSSTWGAVNSTNTLTINTFSTGSVNSYDWLNYLYVNGNVANSAIIKISTVNDPNNFVVFSVQSIVNNATNFVYTVKVLGKGSATGPVSGAACGISWTLVGKNGTSGTTGAAGTSGINGLAGTSGVNGLNGTSGIDGAIANQNNMIKYLQADAADISAIPYPPSLIEVANYINALPAGSKTIDDVSIWKLGVNYDLDPVLDIPEAERKSKYIAVYEFINVGKGVIPTINETNLALSYYEEVRLAHQGGGGSTDQDNFVRVLTINQNDLPNPYTYQDICDYILALPAEDRTIAETDSKWNIVIEYFAS